MFHAIVSSDPLPSQREGGTYFHIRHVKVIIWYFSQSVVMLLLVRFLVSVTDPQLDLDLFLQLLYAHGGFF